jgi:hypothetical protein
MDQTMNTEALLRTFSVTCHNSDHLAETPNPGCTSGELSIVVLGEVEPPVINHENHYVRKLYNHWYNNLNTFETIPFDMAIQEIINLLQQPAFYTEDFDDGPEGNVTAFRDRNAMEQTMNTWIMETESHFLHFLKGIHIYELSKTPYMMFIHSFTQLVGPNPTGRAVKQALHLVNQVVDHILYGDKEEDFYVRKYEDLRQELEDSYGGVKFYCVHMDDGIFIDEICYEGCYGVCDKESVCVHGWPLKYINHFVPDDILFSEFAPENVGRMSDS